MSLLAEVQDAFHGLSQQGDTRQQGGAFNTTRGVSRPSTVLELSLSNSPFPPRCQHILSLSSSVTELASPSYTCENKTLFPCDPFYTAVVHVHFSEQICI